MAWDSNRPVPWRRLVREWLLYVAIMAVVFVLFFRDDGLIGIFAGLLVSGPMYLAFGYVLAKLGHQRKSLKELRAEPNPQHRSTAGVQDGSGAGAEQARAKPAPTRRTGAGGASGRPGGTRRRRR